MASAFSEQRASAPNGATAANSSSTLSIFNSLVPALEGNPDGCAIIATHQAPAHLSEMLGGGDASESKHQCLRWSYSQLHHASLRLAVALRAHGIDRSVLAIVPNGVEWAITLWMSIVLRVTHCGIDTNEEWLTAALAQYAPIINPDVVVVQDATLAATADTIWGASQSRPPKVKLIFDTSAPAPAGWISVTSLVEDYGQDPMVATTVLAEAREGDDSSRIARQVFTAGTVGDMPKLCPKTVGSTAASLQFLTSQCSALTPTSRSLLSTPNSRAAASATALMTWPLGGALVVLDPGQDTYATLDAVKRLKVTHMVMKPNDLHRLVSSGNFHAADYTHLRAVTLAGAVVKRKAYFEATAAFPDAVIVVAHGMAEGGGLFKWPYLAPGSQDIAFHEDVCTVGPAQVGVGVRLVDSHTNLTVAVGQPGELHVSSKSFVEHYADGSHGSSFYEQDGMRWFKTEDEAVMNEAGMYFILGRESFERLEECKVEGT